MRHMDRERESSVSRLFLQVTPQMRRALELLAEASITLLDEIDAPVDECEADPDFEITFEDDEDNGDLEPSFGDDETEPDLGWTLDGDLGDRTGETWTGADGDEDLVAPETSGGLVPIRYRSFAARASAKAAFDPRLALRDDRDRFEMVTGPDGRRWRWEGGGALPNFPHDPPDRPAFYLDDELRRLRGTLIAMRRPAARPRKRRKPM